MRKLEKLQIIKNVSSSWLALGVNVLVGIALSPYILHRLGDAAFGIWILIFSLTGYYGLFDLGIRSSIVRYVSKATATGDQDNAARLIKTSLLSYSCIGAFTFLITLLISAYVDVIFKRSISVEFHSTARWLLLMVGAGVSLGFPLGVAGGVLEGLQKFYVLNWTSVVSTLTRAALIVLALRHGYGLLMVAFITVVMPVITSILRTAIAWHLLPVPIGSRYVDRSTLHEMGTYSSTTLIIIISSRLRFKSDSIIIGAFLSAAAITYFNIGSRIVDYAGEVVESLAQIFVPMSSHSDARGDVDRLRKIFVAGNRFCAFTILPISAMLIILGKSIIALWVGSRYIAQSYPILLILLVPTTLMFAQAASPRVLFGMSKHRTWAVATVVEGVSNVLLSVLLVRPYGIIGDAVGTALPLSATMVFFLPVHLCRRLQIRLRTYLKEAYTLPLVVCAPLTITLLLMKRWFVPHTYLQLAAHVAVAGTVYGLALSWAFVSRRALSVGQLQASPDEGTLAAAAVETYQQDI
jgi:O-antigen/teichoic acid export membrane protein